jgi:hypothetical protein
MIFRPAGLGQTPLARIENHHNFAWKEKDASGNEIIVQRKGQLLLQPASLELSPVSMATPGFILEGKGESTSINSASHGAGRNMSRTKAKQTILPGQVRKVLKHAGVELMGSGVDEAPMTYKDIHQVMEHQKDRLEVKGSFMPKIVRMCGDERFKEVDGSNEKPTAETIHFIIAEINSVTLRLKSNVKKIDARIDTKYFRWSRTDYTLGNFPHSFCFRNLLSVERESSGEMEKNIY